jgi:hypothetical protein
MKIIWKTLAIQLWPYPGNWKSVVGPVGKYWGNHREKTSCDSCDIHMFIIVVFKYDYIMLLMLSIVIVTRYGSIIY